MKTSGIIFCLSGIFSGILYFIKGNQEYLLFMGIYGVIGLILLILTKEN